VFIEASKESASSFFKVDAYLYTDFTLKVEAAILQKKKDKKICSHMRDVKLRPRCT